MLNLKSTIFAKLTKVIAFVFYVLLFVFLFFYIKSIDYASLGSLLNFTWYFILLSILFGIAMRYWQVLGWLVVLKDLGANNLTGSRIELAFVYAKSWLGRYIPGMAPWILGKIYFASKHGVSKSKLAVGSVIESVLQIAAVLALSSLAFILDDRFNALGLNTKILITVVLVVCAVALFPPVFNRLASFAYKLVKKTPLDTEHRLQTKTLLKGAAIYILGGLIYGLFLFFLVKGVYPELAYDNIFFIIGAGNLAGALGILAFFAPSGIGVRDGVLLLLFNLVMPAEIALAATVLVRLFDVALDLMFFVIAWTIKLFNRAA